MDHPHDDATTRAMIRYGGSFTSRLGDLARHADPTNLAKLKHVFATEFARYHELARMHAEQFAKRAEKETL